MSNEPRGAGITYTAKDLAEIAATFETFASDQLHAKRYQSTKRGQRDCDIRSNVYKDCANILRNVKLETEPYRLLGRLRSAYENHANAPLSRDIEKSIDEALANAGINWMMLP